MFDTDLVMSVGRTIGELSDESSELLGFLDKVASNTDFKSKTRDDIGKEVKSIETSLANITQILALELKGE
ncbi:hypothetical protein [Veillonella sp. 3310]|uniref:hypothetical protein n=1 Tax=Veillonella sp. 3310 TaxID=2490956 RepID=UPI000FD6606A|nr:hypothetical protein [Veillonella sp. 3310]